MNKSKIERRGRARHPVFLKGGLAPAWGEPPIQEHPREKG
jgi:hypothetical protein